MDAATYGDEIDERYDEFCAAIEKAYARIWKSLPNRHLLHDKELSDLQLSILLGICSLFRFKGSPTGRPECTMEDLQELFPEIQRDELERAVQRMLWTGISYSRTKTWVGPKFNLVKYWNVYRNVFRC